MTKKFRQIIIMISVFILTVLGLYLIMRGNNKVIDQLTNNNSTTPGNTPTSKQFNKRLYSINDPASIWIVVNKSRPLPDNYLPKVLVVPSVGLRLDGSAEQMRVRQITAKALEALFNDATNVNLQLLLNSGFRSQAYQKTLYNGYVASDGQIAADRSSARPGYSEHQTGFAVDVGAASHKCELSECFSNTPEGLWLAAHVHEYGFIIRYPKDKESITGYIYEPWHVRYVGKELASELYKNRLTMEEFFRLKPATTY